MTHPLAAFLKGWAQLFWTYFISSPIISHTMAMRKDVANWRIALVTVLAFLKVGTSVLLLWIASRIPIIREKVLTKIEEKTIVAKKEDGGKVFFSLKAWIGMARSEAVDLLKSVRLNGAMHNSYLKALDGGSCRLEDFLKAGRPLVVNFGSCTWPTFIPYMTKFSAIAEKFSDRADFLVVYIEEAHAKGEFDFAEFDFEYKDMVQHANIQDRIDAAEFMIEQMEGKLKCPVVVDDSDNNAMYAYGARPERFYVIQDGVVIYQGNRGPFFYDVDAVESFLRDRLMKEN